MSFIRTTTHGGKRIELAVKQIAKVIDNGQGQPAEIELIDGEMMDVKESAQSIRGYIKKAAAGQSED